MRNRFLSPALVATTVACMSLLATAGTASAPASRFEAHLVWATNEDNSPNPSHKQVEADIRKKLAELPLKWTNYFEVNNVTIDVPAAGGSKAPLSEKCEIEVKDLGHNNFEVANSCKGKQLGKHTLAMAKGESLILGGNAPNATAWLVVVKRTQ